jgi:hypothetical protein
MNLADLITSAKEWQTTRQVILDTEAETGYLDTTAIQDSDDEAVDIANALADLSRNQPGRTSV